MIYRDLLPDRAGGRFIASHITLPAGGPLSDWVHYHKVAFQMIFCRRGWIKVVYEGQGGPFMLQDGDCVLQPPQIRHRVLESAAGAEVVEIGCPALHETWADAEMDLPTAASQAERVWEGQRFLRHRAAQEPWAPLADGFERQRTAMAQASAGFADVCIIRAAGSSDLRLAPQAADLAFGFVLEGSAVLEHDGRHSLGPGDAFALPPAAPLDLSAASVDFRLLHVTAQAT
jgi:mannose-6-phosphate isomerase-like protein (cupin superfamily)